jgi:hypothetical protein
MEWAIEPAPNKIPKTFKQLLKQWPEIGVLDKRRF